MRLVPIDDTNRDTAVALLLEGFSTRSEQQWRAILDRSQEYRDPQSQWALGYMLPGKDDEPAGLMLTTASSRRTAGGKRSETVNLHSWYVRPPYRLLAPRMLQSVVQMRPAVFTDITPIPSVRQLNKSVGFRTENEALRFYPMPASALRPVGSSRVLPADQSSLEALPHEPRRILRDHAALGCITGVLRTHEGAYAPLVFCSFGRKALPGLRLVYGPDKASVARHAGAISRFLVSRLILYWCVNANRDDSMPGSIFVNRGSPCQIMGERPNDMIDYAYCETVFAEPVRFRSTNPSSSQRYSQA